MKKDLSWTLEKTYEKKTDLEKNNQTTMQFTLGKVHWGWCVFPLHNQSVTQTFAEHRFLVTIILGGDS